MFNTHRVICLYLFPLQDACVLLCCFLIWFLVVMHKCAPCEVFEYIVGRRVHCTRISYMNRVDGGLDGVYDKCLL